MRCLYCGVELALLKKLAGSENFCSDVHRLSYQEEFSRIALNRLMQAHAQTEKQTALAEVDQFPPSSSVELPDPGQAGHLSEVSNPSLPRPRPIASGEQVFRFTQLAMPQSKAGVVDEFVGLNPSAIPHPQRIASVKTASSPLLMRWAEHPVPLNLEPFKRVIPFDWEPLPAHDFGLIGLEYISSIESVGSVFEIRVPAESKRPAACPVDAPILALDLADPDPHHLAPAQREILFSPAPVIIPTVELTTLHLAFSFGKSPNHGAKINATPTRGPTPEPLPPLPEVLMPPPAPSLVRSEPTHATKAQPHAPPKPALKPRLAIPHPAPVDSECRPRAIVRPGPVDRVGKVQEPHDEAAPGFLGTVPGWAKTILPRTFRHPKSPGPAPGVKQDS